MIFDDVKPYLDLGWYVMLLRDKSKQPHWSMKRGFHDASNNPFIVQDWLKLETNTMNVGIACEKSGLVVVDIDYRNMTAESWAYAKELWADTMTVETGDGIHLYFNAPTGLNLPAQLDAGIDIKYKGYVVAAPSVHPNGKQYEWNQKLPIDYPQHFIKEKRAS
jgi:hypothetical protein